VTVGFQAFNAAAALQIDLTTKLMKVLGTVAITTNSNLTDARFTSFTGTTPWVSLLNGPPMATGDQPEISISGNVLTWHYPNASSMPACTLIYGIY
jgi:hypothetical protein